MTWPLDPDPSAADADAEEPPLPTYVVHARFGEQAPSLEEAVRALRARLAGAHGLYDDVRLERRDDDGTWLLDVRFVVASLNAQTAVRGVAETLADHGPAADEVWADPVPLG